LGPRLGNWEHCDSNFDVSKRIQELHGYLDPTNPHYQPERQYINIKAAIKLYEYGKIDGVQPVSIVNGKVVPRDKIFKGPFCSWSEGRWHQFTQKHTVKGQVRE
jgi:hypothetical protein